MYNSLVEGRVIRRIPVQQKFFAAYRYIWSCFRAVLGSGALPDAYLISRFYEALPDVLSAETVYGYEDILGKVVSMSAGTEIALEKFAERTKIKGFNREVSGRYKTFILSVGFVWRSNEMVKPMIRAFEKCVKTAAETDGFDRETLEAIQADDKELQRMGYGLTEAAYTRHEWNLYFLLMMSLSDGLVRTYLTDHAERSGRPVYREPGGSSVFPPESAGAGAGAGAGITESSSSSAGSGSLPVSSSTAQESESTDRSEKPVKADTRDFPIETIAAMHIYLKLRATELASRYHSPSCSCCESSKKTERATLINFFLDYLTPSFVFPEKGLWDAAYTKYPFLLPAIQDTIYDIMDAAKKHVGFLVKTQSRTIEREMAEHLLVAKRLDSKKIYKKVLELIPNPTVKPKPV